MKYVNLILAVILLAVVGIDAAQDTALDGLAEVRNPVRLKDWLEANAADAETRIAAVESAGVGGTLAPAQIIVGSAASNATAVAVSGDITIATNGAVAIASGVIVNADVATNAGIVSTKLSSAAQSSLALADSALQANLVTVTNVIIGVGDVTNTIVVTGGQITSWTIAQ
jgi:hypothetical protein